MKQYLLLALTLIPTLLSASIVFYDDHRSFQTGSEIKVDLNKDGIDDVKLSSSAEFNLVNYTVTLAAFGESISANSFCGLASGTKVNETCSWLTGKQPLGPIKTGPYCMFNPNPPANCIQPGWPCSSSQFIGVKFFVSGNLHYGWIELDITGTTSSPINYTLGPDFYGIKGYAFEDTPETPLNTGILTNTGIAALEETLLPYPNPASNTIHLNGLENFNSEITIVNTLGKPIAVVNPGVDEISLSSIPSGHYFFVLEFENRRKLISFSKVEE